MEPDDPPKPAVSLTRVLRLRQDLDAAAFGMVGDERIEGDFFYELAAMVRDQLPKSVPLAAVEGTLEPYLGRRLDDALRRELAWRVAGNLDVLKSGRAVQPWTTQSSKEWVAVQFMATHKKAFHPRKGRPRYGSLFSLACMTGVYCPGKLVRWWSDKQCAYAAREFLGFGRGPRGYRHPRQLVGLRALCLLDPELERDDNSPTFRRIAATPSLLAHNKVILARRFRTKPCPFGYVHDCHACGVGYRGVDGEDSCVSAFHARQFVVRYCPACGKDSPFDEDWSTAVCFACYEAAAMRRPEE